MDRQPDSVVVLSEDGGYEVQLSNQNFQTHLELPVREGDSPYSGMDSFETKLASGPGVKETTKLQRMAPSSSNLLHPREKMGKTNSGLFRLQNNETTSVLHEPTCGPGEQRLECPLSTLEDVGVSISFFLLSVCWADALGRFERKRWSEQY